MVNSNASLSDLNTNLCMETHQQLLSVTTGVLKNHPFIYSFYDTQPYETQHTLCRKTYH